MKMKYNNDMKEKNTSGIDFSIAEREALRSKIIHQRLATPDELNVPRKVTLDEVHNWHSDVYKFMDLYNNSELTKCIEKRKRQQEASTVNASAKAYRFWQNPGAEGSATPEQIQEFAAAGDLFADTHPQFTQCKSNLQAMGLALYQANLLPSLENVNRIFTELASAGRLELTIENYPGAPEDAPSESVSGVYAKRWIARMPELLEPITFVSEQELEERRISGLDSESFRREFLIPEISQRELDYREKTTAEFLKKNPTFDEDTDVAWNILTAYLTAHQLGFRLSELNLVYRPGNTFT